MKFCTEKNEEEIRHCSNPIVKIYKKVKMN